MNREMPVAKLHDTNGTRRPERPIMLIFHPGKGMVLEEIKRQIKELDPKSEHIEIYMGSRKELATVVLPLGVFAGRRKINAGLAVLKNMMKYIV